MDSHHTCERTRHQVKTLQGSGTGCNLEQTSVILIKDSGELKFLIKYVDMYLLYFAQIKQDFPLQGKGRFRRKPGKGDCKP